MLENTCHVVVEEAVRVEAESCEGLLPAVRTTFHILLPIVAKTAKRLTYEPLGAWQFRASCVWFEASIRRAVCRMADILGCQTRRDNRASRRF